MNYWSSYLVNLKDILNQKDLLLNISKITPNDIMSIWKESGEETICDFDNIEYDYSMPLYKKMILRFKREGKNDPSIFIKTLDPSNQYIISTWFGIHNYKIFEFFAYIKNQFGSYQINEIGLNSDKWKSNNSIIFFFDLKQNEQQKLIDMYNNSYDNLIKNEIVMCETYE